ARVTPIYQRSERHQTEQFEHCAPPLTERTEREWVKFHLGSRLSAFGFRLRRWRSVFGSRISALGGPWRTRSISGPWRIEAPDACPQSTSSFVQNWSSFTVCWISSLSFIQRWSEE